MLTISCTATTCAWCAGLVGIRRWPFERVLLCRDAWRAALDAWAALQKATPLLKAARVLDRATT